MTSMPISGRILHLQRLSTEDGPGIRTTVFFKGCPLACAWCHNPESIAPAPQVQWLETRCIGCGTCLDACPNGCLTRSDAGVVVDRACCTGCGACAEACPTRAMERLGKFVEAKALAAELLKDRVYFETSGGGVTLSGGEPTLQPDFASALLAELQAAGIHTALDTCGQTSHAVLEALLPHVDLVLYDVKAIDPEDHRDFTGVDNRRVLDNLRFVGTAVREQAPDTVLWIRTPLIPGATASRENLQGIGAFLAMHLQGIVARWELCAFNNLCRDKYRRLGQDWSFAATPLMTADDLAEAAGWAKASGVDPDIVIATGATAQAAAPQGQAGALLAALSL